MCRRNEAQPHTGKFGGGNYNLIKKSVLSKARWPSLKSVKPEVKLSVL